MPVKPTHDTLIGRARVIRRAQTDAEKKLWTSFRARQLDGYKFRRQFVVGSVIADFCCFEQHLIVELDGGQHTDQYVADNRRTHFLASRGYKVLRFWDNEVLQDLNGVLQKIFCALEESKQKNDPHPTLSRGERVQQRRESSR